MVLYWTSAAQWHRNNGTDDVADPRIGLTSLRRTSLRAHHRLRYVHRLAPGALLDLLAAAEAVGEHQRIGRRRVDARQQHALGCRNRHVVLRRLEAERAGHAAAAGGEHLVVE